MYNYGIGRFIFKLRIYQLPDSTNTIMVSNSKEVRIATFLDRERILLQINKRYLMYDQNGQFIADIEF